MLLELEDLHAHYGKSHVLHGVNLQVDEGEFVCLLGRNGVGKSTTLKAIMGMLGASHGAVRWRGRPVHGLPAYRIARLGLGYVPEERRIFPTLSVHENLLIGRKPPATRVPAPWTPERVYEAFPRLGERRRQRAGSMSGGEQQMLTIGRTLMGNPDLVLVDEPTEGLGPMIVERVEEVLRDVQRGGTAVLLVEQAIETALALAQRAYIMAKGQVMFSGSVEQLRSDPAIRKQYLEV